MENNIKHVDFNLNPDVIIKERKKSLRQKFNIDKETLTADDILLIFDQLKQSNSKLNEVSRETASKLFSELDSENKGKIKTDEFIEHISIKLNLEVDDAHKQLKEFYEIINEELITKSERIISKLKGIKKRANLANDNQTLDEIDWIISALTEEDIYEPEFQDLNKNTELNKYNGLDYLSKYSKRESIKKQENDIIKVGIIKTNNTLSSTNMMISDKDFYNNIKNRRSTRLSTFISPSLLMKVMNQLNQVDAYDFDIFELNNLVGDKTMYYIINEIFSRKSFYIGEGPLGINENKFKNFIDEVVKGYDRKIAYHNDLHAGDALQTVFTLVERGDLANVFNLNKFNRK